MMCFRDGVWFLLLGLSGRLEGQEDGANCVATGGWTQWSSVQCITVLLHIPCVQVSQWFWVSPITTCL